MKRTRIKICGLTRASDAEMIEGVWALGIILHHHSVRSVSLKAAQEIVAAANVPVCGVFCDQPLDKVLVKADKLNLPLLQFHGQESGHYCRRARELSGAEIIKARRIKTGDDVRRLLDVESDYYLFDGPGQGTFDWTLLEGLKSDKPTIIAGALTADNVCAAIKTASPWGVDLARGSESAPGIKDQRKITRFRQAVDCC